MSIFLSTRSSGYPDSNDPGGEIVDDDSPGADCGPGADADAWADDCPDSQEHTVTEPSAAR